MLSSRTTRTFLIAVLITGAIVAAFGAGIGTAWLLMGGGNPLVRRTAEPQEQANLGVFWEAWHLVENHFLGDLPDSQHLAWGAIRGALSTLDDPHTTFLEPQPRQREKEDLSGRFGGIGAGVSKDEQGSFRLDPLPDLPAEKAGVQEGDVAVQVDDQVLSAEMMVEDVIGLLRGKVGTKVRLTLRRQAQPDPIVLEIERQEIPSPSVEWRMLEGADGVGYVRITLFSDRTPKELEGALKGLKGKGMAKLVLDLRGNGGGLLNAAVDVASQFLGDGVILYQEEKGATETGVDAQAGGQYLDGLLTVLVDGGTASASEIVAGALQDRGRARLVGEKTYGKGSVQSVFDLNDGSSVHITSARWLTPHGHQINGQGLTPDLEVGISDQDRSDGRDPQLDRAVEYLTTGN